MKFTELHDLTPLFKMPYSIQRNYSIFTKLNYHAFIPHTKILAWR